MKEYREIFFSSFHVLNVSLILAFYKSSESFKAGDKKKPIVGLERPFLILHRKRDTFFRVK